MVKGILLVHLHSFVVHELGDEAWVDLLDSLRPQDREILDRLLLAGAWQPVGVWNRALDALFTTRFPDPDAAMGNFARFVAQKDLSSLFRLVLKLGSPDFILGRTASLYSRYFQEGQFAPHKIEDQHWSATLAVSRDENVGPTRLSCEPGISAWLTQALQLSGTRPIVTHPKCRFRGSPYCEYDLCW
jgi:hypothetical protein